MKRHLTWSNLGWLLLALLFVYISVFHGRMQPNDAFWEKK
jgi:hypothetical protein